MFKAFRTLRARLSAIALIPSLALLLIGGGGAAYLVLDGQQLENWAAEQEDQAAPAVDFARTVQTERRVTLLRIAGDREVADELQSARAGLDTTMRHSIEATAAYEAAKPGSAAGAQKVFEQLGRELLSMRARVDTNAVAPLDAYAFYNQLMAVSRGAMSAYAHSAPDTEIALGLATVVDLIAATDAFTRAHDLAIAGATAGGSAPEERAEVVQQIGFFRNQMMMVEAALAPEAQASWQELTASAEWQRLQEAERVLLQGTSPDTAAARTGTRSGAAETSEPPPIPIAEWQAAVVAVTDGLLRVWNAQIDRTTVLTHATGDNRANRSLVAGLTILAVSIVALVTALQLSSRMIRRLHRLRDETITLTDDQLPDIVGKLRRGEQVDVESSLQRLEFGSDEIGEVADAFNRAQLTAVRAAEAEAQTRTGVNTVFLNIAYRSQVVLHRHLKLLDEAEYEQEDPKVLDLLFRLHHLATRERRNAENLIILGGEQPRRQWRNPVRLEDLVRGAVAEAQDYMRVRVVRLPDVRVIGSAIADLMHLLAELVDNATSFSPPDSRVEVSGNAVGRGVVVEIVDQGLGIPADRMAELNEMLSSPPDFALAALTRDNRLGMFVVARLAARIDVSVRLAESEYGGVKAVVLVPAALLSADDDPGRELPAGADRAPAPVDRAPSAMADPGGYHTAGGGAHSWQGGHAVGAEQPGHRLDGPVADRYADQAPPPHDPRPDLPRRRRQESLAPQLAHTQPPEQAPHSEPPAQRSAHEAKALYTAIENGTRQGRVNPPRYPNSTGTDY
ncbi:sensor histidine kinase [Nocardia harenae]|uniref:sensor histidine kinase n=1 Tax=Nocardia harenae TaxID=358707 RepID=UPI000830FDC1|nr:nitrate- and nitrite sensing domain-containing protein [Nocardia harenae]